MATAELDKNVAEQMEHDVPAGDDGFSGAISEGVGEIVGENATKGLKLPRLQLVYGVGNLAKTFSPGDLVYGQDNLLVHKGEPLEVVIFKALEYWKEYMDAEAYNAGMRPRVFLTEAEVHAAGGITRWPPRGTDGPKPNFSEAMDLSLLIAKPASVVCGLFGIELEGKEYGAAVWSVDKMTYKRIGPFVKMCRQFSLRKRGLLSGRFVLHTSIEQIKNRVVPLPNLRLSGHNSDGFIAAVSAMLGVAPPPGAAPELPAGSTAQLTA
jgi:hypothetical protein